MENVYEKLRRHVLSAGKTKKAYTKAYGCAQNEADMETLRGMIEIMGYEFTDDQSEADLITINTCAVREGAEDRIYGNVGAFKKLKEKNPDLIIVVSGCMTQQEKTVEKLKNSYPYVDIVFGTHGIEKFPERLLRRLETGKRILEIEEKSEIVEGLPMKRKEGASANVSIIYGCNNFCSYCIVPYARGRERSRSWESIVSEIEQLAKKGVTEITLLGQNVNSYGKDLEGGINFAQLLRKINEIEGIKRIRFMTSHPKDLSDELILAMAECDKVCKQLHLPVQAGSNRVLRDMNRKYTREDYLALVDRIRKAIPDITLTTDIIVGFPNETKEEFEDTLDIVKKVRYDGIFSFIYSKRSGTPAAKMPDVTPEKEKSENLTRLLEVQKEIQLEINKTYLGKTLEVLVDGTSKTDEQLLSGRTEGGKIVHFAGEKDLVGKYVNVKITSVKSFYLTGEIV
ncbi:MAG: tRNA (N6-isopentenyl adenosine(37)-C2)-methylthiotransferase MiaB [Monoglobales bacterium]